MARLPINILLLTSSRADFGIYLPLIEDLKKDSNFNLNLVVFGTHLSNLHGYTYHEIKSFGLEAKYLINHLVDGDNPESLATSMGLTMIKFAQIWQQEFNQTDLVIALGDRFEVFSAVMASLPFNIPIAHLHGGETSLGAIDNVFRHSISLVASYHFASSTNAAERIKEITHSNKNIYAVGALSLDKINRYQLYSTSEFNNKFGVNLDIPTVLITYHPETINLLSQKSDVTSLIKALENIDEQLLITLPNVDTGNEYIRQEILRFASGRQNVFTKESLGAIGYFSAMKHCAYILGNSSSGIIEAASFKKYVINIGDRQKGRECGSNVFHCNSNEVEIGNTINKIKLLPPYTEENIYGNGHTSEKIINILKTNFSKYE